MSEEVTPTSPPASPEDLEPFDPTKHVKAFNPDKLPPNLPVPYSVRKDLFDTTHAFLRIRNMAYLNYKIMSYQDTLNAREPIKEAVLDYELKRGWLCDDRENPVVKPEVQTQGADVIMFNPSQLQPVSGMPQVTPPVASAPMSQGAIPPPGQVMPPPPMATPQMQAAGIPPAVPSQLVAPPMATSTTEGSTGRKRRGVSVVPQGVNNGAMPPAPMPQQSMPPTQVAPAQFPQQQAYTPLQQFPAQMPFNAPPAATPWTAPVPPQTAAVPIPVTAPAMAPTPQNGAATESILKAIAELKVSFEEKYEQNSNLLKSQINALKCELEEVRGYTEVVLAAAHHLYMTNQTLAQSIPQGEARTAPEFITYMNKFVPK